MLNSHEAEAFCRAAVKQGLLKPGQVEEFAAQAQDGIQSPGAYFMISSILRKEQVEKVNEMVRTGSNVASGVTRIMHEEDTVFHLPPMATREAPGEDTKVLDVSDADPDAEKKGDSGIVDADSIIDMDDTALQLPAVGDGNGEAAEEKEPAEPANAMNQTGEGFNLLDMDDAALQGGPDASDASGAAIRHVTPDARAFCEAAVAQKLITPEQAREFEQQADGGFQDPGTFFMLSGGLTPDHVEDIRRTLGKEAAKDSGEGPTKKLMRTDDSILDLPEPVADAKGPESYVAEEVSDPQPASPGVELVETPDPADLPVSQKQIDEATTVKKRGEGVPVEQVETPAPGDRPTVMRKPDGGPQQPPTVKQRGAGVPMERVETPAPDEHPTVHVRSGGAAAQPPTVKQRGAEMLSEIPGMQVPRAPGPASDAGIGKPSLLGQYMILGELGRGSVGFEKPGGRVSVLRGQRFAENELPMFLVNPRHITGSCVAVPGHSGLYKQAGQPAVCWWTETRSDPSDPEGSLLDFHIESVQVTTDADWVAYKVRLT